MDHSSLLFKLVISLPLHFVFKAFVRTGVRRHGGRRERTVGHHGHERKQQYTRSQGGIATFLDTSLILPKQL